MNLRLFKQPKFVGQYLQIGNCGGGPIYIGREPPKDWVARPTDNGRGVCINEEAFEALQRNPKKFRPFLRNICGELTGDTIPYNPRSEDLHKEVIQYLRQQKVLD